jgi:16S rRNA G966 N2-methylase RsmD
VVRADAIAWLDRAHGDWSVVIVDPPYADVAALERVLTILGRPGVLPRDARVVAKHFWKDDPPATIGLLASERRKRFGETALTFYRVTPVHGEEGGEGG